MQRLHATKPPSENVGIYLHEVNRFFHCNETTYSLFAMVLSTFCHGIFDWERSATASFGFAFFAVLRDRFGLGSSFSGVLLEQSRLMGQTASR
jgi:hypothetical protein